MTLKQLFYVVCNRCEAQAGSDDNMGTTAAEALQRAQDAGFRRRKRGGRMVDLCHGCLQEEEEEEDRGVNRLLPRSSRGSGASRDDRR